MSADLPRIERGFFLPQTAASENGEPENRDETAKALGELVKGAIREIVLFLPYEQQMANPLSERVQQLTMEWIERHGIITDPERIRKIQVSKFGYFLGQCHPRAKLEELRAAAEFATWLFIYDDMIEKCENKDEIQGLHARTITILNGNKTNEEDDPLTQGLYEIMQRINKVCRSSLWTLRFIKDVQDYCEGTLWELSNRQRKQVPSLMQYRQVRPDVSGTKVMFDFIEIIEHISIPENVFATEYFKRLRLLGANLVNWENDILSSPKEYLNKDVHNLVFVYKDQYHLDFEEAFRRASNDLKSDLQSFEGCANEVPDFKDYTKAVRKYITGIQEWVAAHHFWAKESPRYNSYFRKMVSEASA